MAEQKRFSKNYPACRNCVNLIRPDYKCFHYKTKGEPKKLSWFTINMNYKFKPKSCKAFESRNTKI